MKTHKWAIIFSIVLFFVSGSISLYIQQQPIPVLQNLSRDYSFLQNVAMGVWSSNLLVLILEIINYSSTKDDLIFQYINESQKLYNLLQQVSLESGNSHIDLGDLIINIGRSLDFTYLFNIYNSFSFFITLYRFNKYKASIDDIQKSLFEIHQYTINFRLKYQMNDTQGRQTMKQEYLSRNQKALEIVFEKLEELRMLRIKNYSPIIPK
jgi:hypothetical protein